jgi:lysophospholipid acyltransferase (LPLAT)-like uncharacterized protein
MKPLKKHSYRQYALAYGFGWLIRMVSALLFLTCRVRVYGRDIEKKYFLEHPGRALLYATWHRGLMFFVYLYRFQNFVVMASASRDGELATQVVERHGWVTVRGSSSYRGTEALREMVALCKQGQNGGLVVDAPRGPAHVSKIGIIVAARMTGLPILPAMWSADRCWRLKNWDRTIIPKPFSRIAVVYGADFIRVPAKASKEDCERLRQHLDETLNRLMFQTDHFFSTPGVDDPRHIEVTAAALNKYLADFKGRKNS